MCTYMIVHLWAIAALYKVIENTKFKSLRKWGHRRFECKAWVHLFRFPRLVVESLRGWSEEASHTISRTGYLLGQRTGAPPADTTRRLFQMQSIILWKGNASLWLQHLPTCSSRVDWHIWPSTSLFCNLVALILIFKSWIVCFTLTSMLFHVSYYIYL